MRFNICIDIDGTITNPYCWLDALNKHFNKKVEPKDVTEYEIHKVLNIAREDYLKFYDVYGEKLHLNATARSNAREVLYKLNATHNISYVTARPKRMEDVTRMWFENKNLPMTEVYLLGSHFKVKKAMELNCDIFIEDRYENALQLALKGFKVLLIDCNYNRYPLVSGMTRVFDWDDIYTEISKYYYERQSIA
ncbi:MAG: hypothetical protein FH753_14055 [Firmicutes bacterium]|nr:hypothetical protein [Bacillota bacterium]